MADTEKNTARGTDDRETAGSSDPKDPKGAEARKGDKHDPWDRRELTPDDPNYGLSRPPQTENAGDFGVVSSELVAEQDPDNPGVPKETEEAKRANEEAQRKAEADRKAQAERDKT